MIPFFHTPERQQALAVEARAWLGTPFVAHGACRGAGVDCVHLLGAVYAALGVLPADALTTLPGYACDSGAHARESALLAWLRARPEFAERQAGEATAPGDLVAFRVGRVVHHGGLLIEGTRFVHAVRRFGVIESDLRDPTYGERLETTFTPLCSATPTS